MAQGTPTISLDTGTISSGAPAPSDGVLNMDMISAGVRAFKAWNPDELEVEGMVCEVFFAMLAERQKLSEIA